MLGIPVPFHAPAMESQSNMDVIRDELIFCTLTLGANADIHLVRTSTTTTFVTTTTTVFPVKSSSSVGTSSSCAPHRNVAFTSSSSSSVVTFPTLVSSVPSSPAPAITSSKTSSIAFVHSTSQSNTSSDISTSSNTTLQDTPTPSPVQRPTPSPTRRTSGLSHLSVSLLLCGTVLFIFLFTLVTIVWIRKKRRRIPFAITRPSSGTSPILDSFDPFASSYSPSLLSSLNMNSPLFSRPGSVWRSHSDSHSERSGTGSHEEALGLQSGWSSVISLPAYDSGPLSPSFLRSPV